MIRYHNQPTSSVCSRVYTVHLCICSWVGMCALVKWGLAGILLSEWSMCNIMCGFVIESDNRRNNNNYNVKGLETYY